MEKKIVDARGLACPLPVVNAKKAVEEMKEDGILTVLVDNEIAVQNLQRFAQYKGFESTGEKKTEKEFVLTMQIAAAQQTAVPNNEEAEEIQCHTDMIKKGMTVVKKGKHYLLTREEAIAYLTALNERAKARKQAKIDMGFTK